jgi:hypothetical protein
MLSLQQKQTTNPACSLFALYLSFTNPLNERAIIRTSLNNKAKLIRRKK